MFHKHLKNIKRTSQYNFDRTHFLRMDANERVKPFEKKIISNLKGIINNNILQSYPTTPQNLINLISKKEKLEKKYINLVPGSDSAIKYIFEIFSRKNNKIVSIYPTYGMIDVYSKIYQFKLVKFYENKIKNFLLNSTYRKLAFLYIANPNQPSGRIIKEDLINKIVKKAHAKNKYIIIDEAYIDFSKQKSCAQLIKKYKNLIILKTFSKSIGIAGLRIGYMICDPNVAKIVNSTRPIFDISYFSLKVAEYFLLNPKLLKNYLKEITACKKFVAQKCLKRKLKFLNTEANFFHIFFEKSKIKKISKFLKNKKILVKSKYSKGFRVMDNSIRVTYGSKQQMSYFFNQLDKVY